MYEPELVYGFYRKGYFSHVEASDVFGEDFILDEHRHQVTSGQELHKHVEEGVVLESCVQFDDPWAVRLGEDVTLGSDMSKLIFLELLKVSFIRSPVQVVLVEPTISCFTSDFKA